MKYFQFHTIVASLVSKVADQPLRDVDADFDIEAYFDSDAEVDDQEAAAKVCAGRILFENGFVEEEV